MVSLENRRSIAKNRLDGRTMLCVVALTLAEARPLREQMEQRRIIHANETPVAVKQELGQYFTPGHIADFMASLLPKNDGGDIRILDPGAGIGILSCALAERIAAEKWNVGSLAVDAYEIDQSLIGHLQKNLEQALSSLGGRASVVQGDFLTAVAEAVKGGDLPRYTHVIMNPPYKKIRTASKERELVQSFGLETVNLYTAFLGASIVSTVEGGYIVAIVPRSFCNGTYYRPFREFLLKRCSIERIHLFDSRDTAFKDEAVLQENIIIMLRKGGVQGVVTVSYSKDGSLTGLQSRVFRFAEIVDPQDNEMYINIPRERESGGGFDVFKHSLGDVGVQVSTGAVVDFRSKDALRKEPECGSVPLLYSVHFKNWRVRWPVESKRPNAIARTPDTEKMLLPNGYYVAVKRFSAKEERRRLVASLVRPEDFTADAIAFENHLNVFMQDKHGLDKYMAYGIVVWLNTTWLDEKFRAFSGHTQVNATDLRNLPYPSAKQLSDMGRKIELEKEWAQEVFDRIAKEVADGQ